MRDVEKYILESIENIKEDRDVTKSLLKDVMMYLSGDETRHERVGQVAAKIRSIRPPEPFKGKGIRYVGEYVKIKKGKTVGE